MGLGTGTAVNPTTTDSNDFTPGPPPTGPTLKPVSAPTDPPTTVRSLLFGNGEKGEQLHPGHSSPVITHSCPFFLS